MREPNSSTIREYRACGERPAYRWEDGPTTTAHSPWWPEIEPAIRDRDNLIASGVFTRTWLEQRTVTVPARIPDRDEAAGEYGPDLLTIADAARKAA